MVKLRKIGIFLVIFSTMLLMGFVKNSIIDGIQKSKMEEFSVEGYIAKVDGNNMVVGDNNQLKVYDLHSKELKRVLTIPGNNRLYSFDIFGNYVVWSDTRNENTEFLTYDGKHSEYNLNLDIFISDIITGEEKQITNETSSQTQPKLWKNYIVYKDNSNDDIKKYPGKWSLYLYDLKTGKKQLIVSKLSAYSSYSIRDNKIVYEDDRNFKGPDNLRGAGNVPENNKDIYVYDMTTKKETAVATGKFMESNPDIYGNYIVYEDRNRGSYDADIVLYNIVSKKKVYITRDKYNQSNPHIYGDFVIWMDERNGISDNDVIINGKMPNSDIFIYNIKTKKEKNLTGKEPQVEPSISLKWASYITSRQINPIVTAIKYRE